MQPEYTRRERQVDRIVHLVGVAASLVAAGVLLGRVIPTHDALSIIAATVYSAGLVATFGLSASYNLVVHPVRKETLRKFDHAMIFVMIAGTYTPFALVSLGGTLGMALFAVVWIVAIGGFALKFVRPRRFERVSVLLYLALGWFGLFAINELVTTLTAPAFLLLGSGGILYTIGVVFHLWKTLPYHNAVWHAFVAGGAGCHYIAVLEAVVSR